MTDRGSNDGAPIRVLHLAPAPQEPTGLAGYAAALERAAGDRSDLVWTPGRDLGTADLPLRRDGAPGELHRRATELAERWRKGKALDDFDVVHAEIGGGSYREFYLARALAGRKGVPPLVLTLHDPPFTVGRTLLERGEGAWTGAAGRVLRRAAELTWGYHDERRLVGGAAAVIALSRAGGRTVRQRFRGVRTPVVAIEHIALGGLDAPASAASIQREVRLLWLGFWVPGAGLDTLLDALARLQEADHGARPPWRLWIAGGASPQGNGGTDPRLRQRVRDLGLEERVSLLGYVPETELDRLFRETHALILPRERRGRVRRELMSVSGSMIRAMGFGQAVIATDARAAAEEIRSGQTGFLVEAGDVGGLAEAIGKLVTDPHLCARLGQAAQGHIRQFHRPERILEDHRVIYRFALTGEREGARTRPLPGLRSAASGSHLSEDPLPVSTASRPG